MDDAGGFCFGDVVTQRFGEYEAWRGARNENGDFENSTL